MAYNFRRNDILVEKEKIEKELTLNKTKDIDYIKIPKDVLKLDIPKDKLFNKVVNKIEFDSNKNVKMSLNITI